jgi:uncharacterized cupin superfamily protein
MSDEDRLFAQAIVHYSALETDEDTAYPGDAEQMGVFASFAEHFKTSRLGVHHHRLPPGQRSSWPHAEADEEEFVFVLEGEPDLWLDGHVRRLKPGDGAGFPSGTGIAHCLINNTETDVRLLVVGEASRFRSRIHYPLHPKRNAEIGARHWADHPQRPLGPHDGRPDKLRT